MTTVYRVHQDFAISTSAAWIFEYGIFLTIDAARDAVVFAASVSLERWFGHKMPWLRDKTRYRIINPPFGAGEIEFEITDEGTYIFLGRATITIKITPHELDKFTGEG